MVAQQSKVKKHPANFPCVAQPGRAPGLGPGGRMFESCHTDQETRPYTWRIIG